MRRLPILFGMLAAALLLSGCGGAKLLMRMGIDGTDSFRVEKLGLGTVEGRLGVALYNGNRTAVTFGSGRVELLAAGRTVGVATLRESVTVAPGSGRVEVPVRIRFPQEGLRALLGLVVPSREGEKGRELRIAGTIGIDREGRKRSVVRFKRRVDRRELGQFARSLVGINLLEINR